ncbi:MAG: D-tyrosyl-tRNA(Tyr) deacylase [Leptospirales bacterium]|nr:D-tyrosyl-tRNA(Tyr) deacylase [Leptospirales bacterium]
MRILLQRVTRAEVRVEHESVGAIGRGLLLLVGFGQDDVDADRALLEKMARKSIGLRIFPDEAGKMNRSLADTGGGALLVPQFTLYADARQGKRPAFTAALSPPLAEALFESFVASCRTLASGRVATGRFGAEMQVELVNDGPVTLWLDSDLL